MPLVRGASRRRGGPSSAIYAALCAARSHTPHESNVASRTLYQAEGRVLLRWETSKQNASAASASQKAKASCSARSLSVLYAARRSPLVLVLRYERSLSIVKLPAHRSLQALQGTTPKIKTPC